MNAGSHNFNSFLDSMKDNVLNEAHLKTILYNSLCCFKFIHSANVIHRNVKPANLMLDNKCRVMICDFGLSRTMPEKDDFDKNLKKLHKKNYN